MAHDLEDNAEYFGKRETQERALAEAATDPAARHVHRDLAKQYAERRRALIARMPDTV